MIDRYAHASEAIVGAREHQEDSCLFSFAKGGAEDPATGRVSPGELVAVLADGMGGHVAGERASQTACLKFAEAYADTLEAPRERMSDSLAACNDALADAVREDERLDGMGCTLLATAFGDTGLRWVSVGDSHLYLFRDDKLYMLNEDHSMAPVIDEMVSQGLLGADQARDHPRRHLLRSALTGDPIEMVDLGEKLLPLEPNDWVLLATDGIETLESDEIAVIVAAHINAEPADLVSALMDAVEEKAIPQQDNTTVMAIQPKFS